MSAELIIAAAEASRYVLGIVGALKSQYGIPSSGIFL
jgi:hypothetical protein